MARSIPARPSRFSANYDHRHRPRARARIKGTMGDMNVTPFIDVLLVLLHHADHGGADQCACC